MFINSCRCKQPRGIGTVFGPEDARHSYIILNTQMLWLGGRCSSLVRYFRDGHTRSKWEILRENILRVVKCNAAFRCFSCNRYFICLFWKGLVTCHRDMTHCNLGNNVNNSSGQTHLRVIHRFIRPYTSIQVDI